MGKFDVRKEWNDLEFYLWRVRRIQRTDWPKNIYLHGTPKALQMLRESLQTLLNSLAIHGHGTRRFKSNPPKDFDFQQYGKKVGAEFEWFEWFMVRLMPDAPDDEPYKLEGRNVAVAFNSHALEAFISAIATQLSTELRYPHGGQAPGGFYFAPDWLGME